MAYDEWIHVGIGIVIAVIGYVAKGILTQMRVVVAELVTAREHRAEIKAVVDGIANRLDRLEDRVDKVA